MKLTDLENSLNPETDVDGLEVKKIQGWTRLIRCMVHDLTTPLVSMRMSAQALSGIMPDLIEGYEAAVAYQLIASTHDPAHVKRIQEKTLAHIETEVRGALKRLQSINAYMEKFTLAMSGGGELLSMQHCLDKLLHSYPFKNEAERALVHVDIVEDFSFQGIDLFVQDLLLNLLHNALSFIGFSGRGELTILANKEGAFNILHFKDTGPGIKEARMPEVFKRFFSIRAGELKAGLGFCRQALWYFGGDLCCESVEDEYTDFILKFPKLSEQL